MQALRELFGAIVEILDRRGTSGDLPLQQVYKRVVSPAGAPLLYSGALFALGQSQDLVQAGEPQQQIAVLRWLQPSAGALSNDVFFEREIGEDIAALLSLASRRRIRTLPEVAVTHPQANPTDTTTLTIFLPTGDVADSELPSPLPNHALSGIESLMWDVLSVADEREFTAIAQGARLYHAALLVASPVPSASYTLLVAALETLSSAADLQSVSWAEWSEAPGWDAFLAHIGLTGEKADSVRSRLVSDRQLNLTRRFVAYVTRMIPDSFWSEPWGVWAPGVKAGPGGNASLIEGYNQTRTVDERGKHGPKHIPELLKNVYRARSGYIHQGKSLRGSVLVSFSEVEPSADASATRSGQAVPSLEYLERLVRAVLLEAIRIAPKRPGFHPPDLRIIADA